MNFKQPWIASNKIPELIQPLVHILMILAVNYVWYFCPLACMISPVVDCSATYKFELQIIFLYSRKPSAYIPPSV